LRRATNLCYRLARVPRAACAIVILGVSDIVTTSDDARTFAATIRARMTAHVAARCAARARAPRLTVATALPSTHCLDHYYHSRCGRRDVNVTTTPPHLLLRRAAPQYADADILYVVT